MKKAHQSGLSLLELLVTFVIVSMVSVLIAQGFGFGLSLYDRIESRNHKKNKEALIASWFSQVNGNLVAYSDANLSLKGESDFLTAVTANPLLGDSGVPTRVEWLLKDETLHYIEGDSDLVMMAVPGAANFVYENVAGTLSQQWPMNETDVGLPAKITLKSGDDQLLASVQRMRLEPDLLLENSLNENR